MSLLTALLHMMYPKLQITSKNNNRYVLPTYTIIINIIYGKEILIIEIFQALPTKKSSQQQQHSNKIERRMVSATPCACDSGSSLLTQSYENYDIPKNISQVSIMNMYIVFI